MRFSEIQESRQNVPQQNRVDTYTPHGRAITILVMCQVAPQSLGDIRRHERDRWQPSDQILDTTQGCSFNSSHAACVQSYLQRWCASPALARNEVKRRDKDIVGSCQRQSDPKLPKISTVPVSVRGSSLMPSTTSHRLLACTMK